MKRSTIRVAVLTTTFPRYPGDSCGNFIFQSVKALAETGVVVRVVTPHCKGARHFEKWGNIEVYRFRYAWPDFMEQLAQVRGGLPYTLRNNLLAQMEFPFFCLCFFLYGYRISRTCDVIHAQWILAAMVAFFIKSIRKVPYVLSLRGTDVNKLLKGKMWMIFKPVLRRASSILTVSDEFRKFIEERTEKEGKRLKVTVLENGVNTEVFSSLDRQEAKIRLSIGDNVKVILFIGRLIKSKGVDYLIRVFSRISSYHQKVLLVIVGDGPFKEHLHRLVYTLKVERQVHFAGEVPHGEVPLWLGVASVFVLPSFSEGRPNVVLEAMAAAVPVVASDIPGVAEIIEDKVNGLLFPPGDERRLEEILNMVLSDDSLAEKIGRAGRETIVKRNLTWQRHAEMLKEIYWKAIRNPL